jgi:hypothetical protein
MSAEITDIDAPPEVLEKGAPEGSLLGLSLKIGVAGAAKLAEVLKGGSCPTGLQCDLRDTSIGDAGATALTNVLRRGQCPTGLQLNLSNTEIGDAGAAKLAETLSTRRSASSVYNLPLVVTKLARQGSLNRGKTRREFYNFFLL